MILYIGPKENGFFLSETIDEEVRYSGNIDIKDLKQTALSKEFSCIVIDLSQWRYMDSALIADSVNDVASSTRAKIIVLAVGFDIGSKLCSSLINFGINNIVTAGNLADIKTEFLDFYSAENNEVIERIQSEILEKEIEKTSAKTIAVVGSQCRIGTTTQCFQIAKYLSTKGYKSAYLEFNNTGYLKKMKKLFSIQENDFSFEGINIFNAKQIKQVLKEYDYIVYDYGSADAASFNQYSFLEKDICIVVCGTKPGEIDKSTTVLSMFQNNDNVVYLFNFVAENDREDIKELMGNHITYFSPLIPDVYTVLLQQQQLYDLIIAPGGRKIPLSEKKKFNLFRRKNYG